MICNVQTIGISNPRNKAYKLVSPSKRTELAIRKKKKWESKIYKRLKWPGKFSSFHQTISTLLSV